MRAVGVAALAASGLATAEPSPFHLEPTRLVDARDGELVRVVGHIADGPTLDAPDGKPVVTAAPARSPSKPRSGAC